MIKSTFKLGGSVQEVVINGNELFFSDDSGSITTFEGLKLSRPGIIKEFPDLEGDPEWKKKAIERFNKHFRSLKSEIEKTNYIKQELEKFGYEALFYQRAGHRPIKWRKQ